MSIPFYNSLMEQTLIQKTVTRDSSEYRDVIAIYEEAFPPEERYPVELLDHLEANYPAVEFMAYFDPDSMPAEGTYAKPCGFAFSVVAEGYLYVSYLAVSAHVRARGLGTRMLSQLRSLHSDCATVLEIEPPDAAAPNNAQRLRRLAFYERNGFAPAGCILRDDEMDYLVLVAPPFDGRAMTFDPEEFVAVMTRATGGHIPLEILEQEERSS